MEDPTELAKFFMRLLPAKAAIIRWADTTMFVASIFLCAASLRPQIPLSSAFSAVGLFGLALSGVIHVRRLRMLYDRFDTFIREMSEPRKQLKTVLSALLGPEAGLEPYGRGVAANCEGVILAVASLVEHQEIWAKRRHVQFVSSLMYSIVGVNAEELSRLADDDRIERTFEVPETAAELADQILEAQMKELDHEDSYLVISDLETWKGRQLRKFDGETKRAVTERGVTIKRLFNLMLRDVNVPNGCGEMLRKHLKAANEWRTRAGSFKGSYSVKLLREEDWNEIERKLEEPLDVLETITASRTGHFGIFVHCGAGGEEMIRFRVEDPTLKKMFLSRHRPTIKASRDVFTQLWEHCPDLSEQLIAEIEESRVPKAAARRAPGAQADGGALER